MRWFRPGCSCHSACSHLQQENPDLSQREIIEQLDISLAGVNYCLRALVGKGLIKIQNFQNSRNKMGCLYWQMPSGIAQKSAMTVLFLKRKLHGQSKPMAEQSGKTEVEK